MRYIIFAITLFTLSCSEPKEQPKSKMQPNLTDENGENIEIKQIDILTIERHQYIRYYEVTEFFCNTDKVYKMRFPVIIHRPECHFCKAKKTKK